MLDSARPERLTAAMSALLLSLLLTATPPPTPGNLLAGLTPLKQQGLTRPAAMTDGFRAPEASFWDTEVTTLIAPGGFAEWDLGEPRPLAAALVLGDNNDSYTLEASLDGQAFAPLWVAGPVPTEGLHTRLVTGLNATARYVRLTAAGGDNLFSVGEVMLFSTDAALPAPVKALRKVEPVTGGLDPTWLVIFGAAAFFVYFLRQRARAASHEPH